ncbi:uncharacterized protein LOC132312676 [Cornus florida]|uniref:uncharacterized protein LOC132312676 n=1 Tax=Cornus florida TaxID=4283 RepID=UPI00289B9F6F|nr:uncharacterized protein LOC132312676 [Cornus florida]
MESAKLPSGSGVRKVKKKQVKDELDRLKQAEKKRRRLEKALATSAAIISELEKKKQKKKEEQQRLDEEGAAIAEAVALHVLLGEESNDSCKIMLNKDDEGFNPWDCASNDDPVMGECRALLPHQDFSKHSLEEVGWLSNAYISGYEWNDGGHSDWSISCGHFGRDLHTSYFDEGCWDTTEISAGLIAAQAVSSLQIAEDSHVDQLVFGRMLRGE